MKATFEDEGEVNEGYIILFVVDNNGAEHEITYEKSSNDLVYHGQDAYADEANEATNEERNTIGRVQRFARYFIYRQRGYPTINPYSDRDDIANPDRLAAATLVIGAMSTDTFQKYFGDYYQQMRSYTGDADPVISPPEINDLYKIVQDIYLNVSEDNHEDLLTVLREADALTALEEALNTGALPGASDASVVDQVYSTLLDRNEGPDDDLRKYAAAVSDLYVEATSPLRLQWGVPTHNEQSKSAPGEVPDLDRGPDARPQMYVADYGFDDIEDFRARLVHHLRCQLRDCYVAMGLRPPENAQVRGVGIHVFANWYEHYDVYQPYHDDSESVDWGRLPPDPTRQV